MTTAAWVSLLIAVALIVASIVWWRATGKFPPILGLLVGLAGIVTGLLTFSSRPRPPGPPALPVTPLPPPLLPPVLPPPNYAGPFVGLDDVAKDKGEEVAAGSDASVAATGAGLFDPGKP